MKNYQSRWESEKGRGAIFVLIATVMMTFLFVGTMNLLSLADQFQKKTAEAQITRR